MRNGEGPKYPSTQIPKPQSLVRSFRRYLGIWVFGYLGTWVFVSLTVSASASLTAEQTEFFENKIRPVFADHCYSCHSDKAEKVKGGLRLDTRDALLKGGNSGPVIVPGDADASPLIKAVRYADPDLQMPPKDKKLSAEQIAAIYLLHWKIEIFFGWWKRHLKVYHLLARSEHALMIQLLAGLITYLLLAIYCQEQFKDKVSIQRVRQLRIAIRNEAGLFLPVPFLLFSRKYLSLKQSYAKT